MKATIVKVPLYVVNCPWCDEPMVEDGYVSLERFRKVNDGMVCKGCGKVVELGRVKNW